MTGGDRNLKKIMTLKNMLHARWDRTMTISLLVFCGALVTPTSPTERYSLPISEELIYWVENQGRFVNTALQVGLPIVTRDVAGLKALAWITLTGTISTHGLKRTLDSVEIQGIRLGQRPLDDHSRHNFPSGHSSMASSGAVFVARRYGWHWLWLVLPMTLATMFVRIALNAHTMPAVIAGAALGVLFTWPLCSKK